MSEDPIRELQRYAPIFEEIDRKNPLGVMMAVDAFRDEAVAKVVGEIINELEAIPASSNRDYSIDIIEDFDLLCAQLKKRYLKT